MRRFTSDLNPIDYYREKCAEGRISQRQIVDIHDIPRSYDVAIDNMTEEPLKTAVAEMAKNPYLAEASAE